MERWPVVSVFNPCVFNHDEYGSWRAFSEVMILLISSLAKAQDCAQALETATHEAVQVCAEFNKAVEHLQTTEFSAVVFDQLLLDMDPDEGETLWKHLGSAVPVCLNFAIAGAGRVVRDLRSALRRRKREMLAARKQAEQALRHDLSDTVTAMLLSCEMALQVENLPELAASRMQAVDALARKVSARLGAMA